MKKYELYHKLECNKRFIYLLKNIDLIIQKLSEKNDTNEIKLEDLYGIFSLPIKSIIIITTNNYKIMIDKYPNILIKFKSIHFC
jgi:hypothetical protein